MTEASEEYDSSLTEHLYVISTEPDSKIIAATLVFFATTHGLFNEAPVLSIKPDWRDTCGLLDSWATEHCEDRSQVSLPTDTGIWEISVSFKVKGTYEEIDSLAYQGMSQCVEDCISHLKKTENVELHSASEGLYYFSLIDVPPVD